MAGITASTTAGNAWHEVKKVDDTSSICNESLSNVRHWPNDHHGVFT